MFAVDHGMLIDFPHQIACRVLREHRRAWTKRQPEQKYYRQFSHDLLPGPVDPNYSRLGSPLPTALRPLRRAAFQAERDDLGRGDSRDYRHAACHSMPLVPRDYRQHIIQFR